VRHKLWIQPRTATASASRISNDQVDRARPRTHASTTTSTAIRPLTHTPHLTLPHVTSPPSPHVAIKPRLPPHHPRTTTIASSNHYHLTSMRLQHHNNNARPTTLIQEYCFMICYKTSTGWHWARRPGQAGKIPMHTYIRDGQGRVMETRMNGIGDAYARGSGQHSAVLAGLDG